MSIHQGAKIITKGLVFAYDMPNNGTETQNKSWKGRPLTNYYPDIFTSSSMRTHTKHYWTGTRWRTDGVYTDPGVPGPQGVFIGKVAKHVSGSLNSTWSGNSYGYMLRDIAGQVSGNYYTQSCWVYVSPDCDITAIPCTIEQESSGETTASTGEPSEYNMSNKGTWQRIGKRAISDGTVRYIPVYPRKNGVEDGSFSGFFMWGGAQVEDGSNVSQLVEADSSATTRSSTQALLDWAGGNTITANSLTYNSDGTFSFNGSSNYISSSLSNSSGDNVHSIDFWMKLNTNQSSISSRVDPFTIGSAANSNYSAMDINNGNINWYFYNNDTKIASNLFVANTWYNIQLTYTGGGANTTNKKIYINGQLQNWTSTTGTYYGDPLNWPANASVSIGRDGGRTTAYFPGSISGFKIYNRALSADEVKSNFQALRGRYGV